MILRLCHEFNGTWNGYGASKETAAAFVAAWHHIVNLFRTAGADNALWCWCPNIWGSAATVNPTDWYPCDDYVDLIGLDGYMTVKTTTVQQPADLFLGNYQALRELTDKPFMLAEVGCANDPRLTATGGKAAWYGRLFDMLREDIPDCLAVGQWERPDPSEGNFTIDSSGTDPAALDMFTRAVTRSPFAPPLLDLATSGRS